MNKLILERKEKEVFMEVSRNVYVEGLMATQCATGGSDSVIYSNQV